MKSERINNAVTPKYCESMFPAKFERIIDFFHVYDEEMELYGGEISFSYDACSRDEFDVDLDPLTGIEHLADRHKVVFEGIVQTRYFGSAPSFLL